ncbi:MAG: hypothetical protein J7485_04475 [Sphingobium sp.]|nr:hypothetical protein [Sphingobium sp.]
MTQLSATSLFAALRYSLTQTNPSWIEASTQAWQDWRHGAGKTLPHPGLSQMAIVARIQCVDDIILHRGLLQLLSLDTVQPLVLFALPTASALAIAQGRALREGWASLVSLILEAELDAAMRCLPGKMPTVLFPLPAPLPQPVLERISKQARDGNLAAAWVELAQQPHEAALSVVRHYAGLGEFPGSLLDEVLVSGMIEALAEANLPERSRPVDAIGSDALAGTIDGEDDREADVWVRPDEVELPSIGRNDLIAVTVLGEGQEGLVTAVQSASLAPLRKGLSIPTLPRHGLETEQRMQIHVFGANGSRTDHEVRFNLPPAGIEPWMLSAYLNRGGGGNPVIRAFATGAACRLAYAEDEPEVLCDIPVVWGVLRDSDRILTQAKAQGLHFFYIDHAYFDRGHGNSYRITRNRYEAGSVRKVNGDRLTALNLDVHPWRKNGRSIIVCPPTEYFAAAHNCADWLETTLAALRLETDRPIIVREKPKPGQSSVPLPRALEEAHALVTHSSNVAIEAACLGTPVFVSPASAAAPIGETDIGRIETPHYPDRNAWLAHLAYSQYAIAEIRDGTAWNILKYLEDCEFA